MGEIYGKLMIHSLLNEPKITREYQGIPKIIHGRFQDFLEVLATIGEGICLLIKALH